MTDSLRELAEKVRQGFIDPSEYPRHHAETSAALEEILRRLEIAEEEARAEYDARQDSHRRVEELKHALREIARREYIGETTDGLRIDSAVHGREDANAIARAALDGREPQ